MLEVNRKHDKYLSEIVQEFDRQHELFTSQWSGAFVRYYASLHLDELMSRLGYNIVWYENRGLTSSAFVEAKKRMQACYSQNCI